MWFFNSGVYRAQWNLLGVPMFDGAGEAMGLGIAALPISDVNILQDWDTMALRGGVAIRTLASKTCSSPTKGLFCEGL
jgi:hypothetical protein